MTSADQRSARPPTAARRAARCQASAAPGHGVPVVAAALAAPGRWWRDAASSAAGCASALGRPRQDSNFCLTVHTVSSGPPGRALNGWFSVVYRTVSADVAGSERVRDRFVTRAAPSSCPTEPGGDEAHVRCSVVQPPSWQLELGARSSRLAHLRMFTIGPIRLSRHGASTSHVGDQETCSPQRSTLGGRARSFGSAVMGRRSKGLHYYLGQNGEDAVLQRYFMTKQFGRGNGLTLPSSGFYIDVGRVPAAVSVEHVRLLLGRLARHQCRGPARVESAFRSGKAARHQPRGRCVGHRRGDDAAFLRGIGVQHARPRSCRVQPASWGVPVRRRCCACRCGDWNGFSMSICRRTRRLTSCRSMSRATTCAS